jgi:hypothetical protein
MKFFKARLMLFGALVFASSHVNALLITPADAIDSGPENSQKVIVGIIEAKYSVSELYKSNTPKGVGPGFGIDEGTFESSYDTFFNDGEESSGGAIGFVGGTAITCPTCYLLVKDGKQDPGWYFFDLGAWDGQEIIDLSGFWPGKGAISNVSIWGAPSQVPEPGPLALLSLGLLGIMSMRRLKRSL